MVVIVVLLLFKRVNVGADNDECNGDDISRTVCGDGNIRFPVVAVEWWYWWEFVVAI